jgi:uncharacterized protein YecE (DUF72 family)
MRPVPLVAKKGGSRKTQSKRRFRRLKLAACRLSFGVHVRPLHNMPPMHLFVGCPVWACKGWVGTFYPQGTKPSDYLREYSRRLTTIEGNTTFYAVPGPKTIEHWLSETPASFRFCPKIPKSISHQGTLAPRIDAAAEFIAAMRSLGERLGPMFLQLPPRYSPRLIQDLRIFLDAWPRDCRLAVEVRHLDWFDTPYTSELNDLLSARAMARVVIDTRPIRSLEGDSILTGTVYKMLLEARRQKPDVPVMPERTTDFIFVRYIGHPQMTINGPLIGEWADYIAAQLWDGSDAYVFCHSPESLAAPFLCRELHAGVARQIALPRLPWDDAGQNAVEQQRLL